MEHTAIDHAPARFARNLCALRQQADMSQQDVADALCVPRSTYASWENASAEPSLLMLAKIQHVFQVGVDVLLNATLYGYTTDELQRLRVGMAPRPKMTRTNSVAA